MSTKSAPTEPVCAPVADAPRGNWVDRFAPKSWQPYLRLARMDRPIGTWLLLFPCWWSVALAHVHSSGRSFPDLWLLLLLAIGAAVMRGAGCAYNDYVDRDYDARVERTASRPIPSGQVTPGAALIFAMALCLVGLGVLVQLNAFTIALASASLLLVAAYPFMKRLTYWPQVVLGLTFNWGALVGWAAVAGGLAAAPIMLYAGSVLWTIGYDTIYAHQDKEDDLMLGLKSTALKFGRNTKAWVGGLYAATAVLWAIAGLLGGARSVLFVAIAIIAAQLAWQVVTLDTNDAGNCLRRFRSNRDVGAILFAGLLAEMLLA